jgi:hypothetical protein
MLREYRDKPKLCEQLRIKINDRIDSQSRQVQAKIAEKYMLRD